MKRGAMMFAMVMDETVVFASRIPTIVAARRVGEGASDCVSTVPLWADMGAAFLCGNSNSPWQGRRYGSPGRLSARWQSRLRSTQPVLDIASMPADGSAAKPSLSRKSPDGGERREHPATPARQPRKVMGGEDLGPGRVGLVDPLR